MGVSLSSSLPVVSSDFDKRVNDNKTAAEEAMKKIPSISAVITAANNKTGQAEAALGNAAADAREAKAKAEEAERIASNVQKVGGAPCCSTFATARCRVCLFVCCLLFV